jgi:cysteinyl-tRNA synthetase
MLIGLAEARWQARLTQNWAEPDVLRGQFAEQGWAIKDGNDTYTLGPVG